jgi:hypothetical protein
MVAYPRTDEYGGHWLSKKTAVFPSKRIEKGEVVPNGWYFAMKDGEFVFDGPALRRFLTPEKALKFLKGA